MKRTKRFWALSCGYLFALVLALGGLVCGGVFALKNAKLNGSGEFNYTEAVVNYSDYDGVLKFYNNQGSTPQTRTISVCADDAIRNSTGNYATEITIPSYVKYSDGNIYRVTTLGSFYEVGKMQKINLPDTLTRIDSSRYSSTGWYLDEYCGVFEDCSSLQSLTIPKNVSSIASMKEDIAISSFEGALDGNSAGYLCYGCDALAEIIVDSQNLTYRSEGNCLIRRDYNVVIAGCKGSIIPEGVEGIADAAFAFISVTSGVTIPSSVTNIDGLAFDGASLTSATFADTKGWRYDDERDVYMLDTTVSARNINILLNDNGVGADIVKRSSDVLEYSYDDTNLTAKVVTADGAFNEYENAYLYVPATTMKDGKTYNVTALGDGSSAFTSTLTTVTTGRFSETSKLSTISDNAFVNCTTLRSIDLPSSLTQIGDSAFLGCTSLSSVTFDFANWYVEGDYRILLDASVPSQNASYLTGDYATGYVWEWYENIGRTSLFTYTTSGSNATLTNIYDDNLFTYILIPNQTKINNTIYTVTAVGDGSNNVIKPNIDGFGIIFHKESTVKTIKSLAFASVSFFSVSLPASVTTIDSKAFTEGNERHLYGRIDIAGSNAWRCGSLCILDLSSPTFAENALCDLYYYDVCTRITESYSYTVADNEATFTGISLTSLTIETVLLPSHTRVDGKEYPVTKVYNEFSTISGGEYLTRIMMGDNVCEVGSQAFGSCASLSGVNLNKVAIISSYAFQDCTALTSITLPETLSRIDYWAFIGSGIESVTIPSSVIYIGYGAFPSNLSSIKFMDKEGWQPNDILDSSMTDSLITATFNFSNPTTPWRKDGVITYSYNSSTKEATVVSVAASQTSIEIPSSVTYNGSTYNVVAIGNGTDSISTTLTTIILPSSIKKINDRALRGSRLNGSVLASINLPSSITSIGANAFQYCTSLTSFTLPNSVQTLGEYAFSDCTGLTSFSFGTVPGITTIPIGCFSGCTGLTSIKIDDNYITEIWSAAFNGCTKLTEAYITGGYTWYCYAGGREEYWDNELITTPNSFAQMLVNGYQGEYAERESTRITFGEYFVENGVNYACVLKINSSLTSISIPEYTLYQDEVYTVGIYGSGDGSNTAADTVSTTIGSIIFPSKIRAIYAYAFYGNTAMSTLSIPETVLYIGEYAFANSSIKSINISRGTGMTVRPHAFANMTSLTSFVATDGSLTEIPEECFAGDTKLATISASTLSKVEKIGKYAFKGTKISQLDLGNKLTTLSEYAFANMTSLTKVNFSSIRSFALPAYCFYNDTALADFILDDRYITSIGKHAFQGCSALANVYISGAYRWTCEGMNEPLKTDFGLSMGSASADVATKLKTYSSSDVYWTREGSAALVKWRTYGTVSGEMFGSVYFINASVTSIIIEDYTVLDWGLVSVHTIGTGDVVSSSLKILTINGFITSIGENAFLNNTNLDSVSFPEILVTISAYAFCGCTKLTSVTFNSKLHEIGDYAFYGCSKLRRVTLNAQLSSIGNWAFYNTSLTYAKFEYTDGWYVGGSLISSTALANTATAATYLKSTYADKYWRNTTAS